MIGRRDAVRKEVHDVAVDGHERHTPKDGSSSSTKVGFSGRILPGGHLLDDVDEHAARIRRGLVDDPAQAIGSSKELLETVLKAVLGLHGNGPETRL